MKNKILLEWWFCVFRDIFKKSLLRDYSSTFVCRTSEHVDNRVAHLYGPRVHYFLHVDRVVSHLKDTFDWSEITASKSLLAHFEISQFVNLLKSVIVNDHVVNWFDLELLLFDKLSKTKKKHGQIRLETIPKKIQTYIKN